MIFGDIYCENMLDHSHKKRKDRLETQAEGAVLCAYIENHAILEPILLYRASKYNKQKCRAIKTVTEVLFFLLIRLISGFFLSSFKIPAFQDQTLSKKCCNFSKKQISTISNTEWRAQLVDH